MRNLPEYAEFGSEGNFTAMRKVGDNGYYRDAGDWGLKAEMVGDEIIVTDCWAADVIGWKGFPISKEKWEDDNKGYI